MLNLEVNMVDIYLKTMMQGELDKPKSLAAAQKKQKIDKFDAAYNELFDHFVDSTSSDLPQETLIPNSIQREKRKKDLMDNTQCLNLEISLKPAIDFLTNKKECQYDFSQEEYDLLLLQFSKISFYLKKIDFTQIHRESLYSLLHLTESTMQAIFRVAIAKYNEEEFETSFNLFSLLATLDQENEDYWYRLGIAAIQIGKLELALQSLAFTLYLNQKMLGARLFSAECYLRLDQLNDAKAELEEAKKIVEDIPQEQIWLDLLVNIEERTNAAL